MNRILTPDNLEYAVIGSCMNPFGPLDKWRAGFVKKGLKAEHFRSPLMRKAYEIFLDDRIDNRDIMWNDIAAAIGQSEANKAAGRGCEEGANWPWKLVDELIKREAKRKIEAAMKKPGASLNAILAEIHSFTESYLAGGESGDVKMTSLKDVTDPTPEEVAAVALFDGDWLSRGQSAMLSAASGIGKSVIAMQFAYGWGAGRAVFDIKPIRPLKIGIFQTEDGKLDRAAFVRSMRTGHREILRWTDKDIELAESNVEISDEFVKCGDEFANFLYARQVARHYDLIIVNPLYTVAGIDLNNNEQVTDFLANKISRTLHCKGHECGMLIVHHENKPSAMPMSSAMRDQQTAYAGSGASSLSRFMRAKLAIQNTSEKGKFLLVASKRGEHLDWPENPKVKSTLPSRFIRHAPKELGIMFWLDGEGDSGTVSKEPVKADNPEEDAKALAEELKKEPKRLTEARDLANKLFKRHKRVTDAYNKVRKNPGKYGLVLESGDGASKIFKKKRT